MNVAHDAEVARRMVIALDAALCESIDLEAAAELAELLGTALHALFVEDPDLVALAGLPIAREVARVGARTRPLDREAVESAVRRRVERASGALTRVGEKRMLSVSYSTERGKVVHSALACGGAGEIVVLPAGLPHAPGIAAPPRARHQAQPTRPVMVWYDASPGTNRALVLAQRIARHTGGDLFVGYHEADANARESLRRFLGEVALEGGGPVWLRPLTEPRMDLLAQVLRSLGAGQFVLSTRCAFAGEEALAALIAQVAASLILVRE